MILGVHRIFFFKKSVQIQNDQHNDRISLFLSSVCYKKLTVGAKCVISRWKNILNNMMFDLFLIIFSFFIQFFLKVHHLQFANKDSCWIHSP